MTTIKKNSADQSVRLIAIIGILIFANILGISWFARVDMTGDNQFTLNRASKRIVSDLKDPVTVKAYFTDNLPPPYSNNRRYVKDLLDEYYAASDGKFRYEFIDPKAEETEEDKEKKKEVKHDIFGRAVREATSIERELRTLGIQEVNVQVLEDDRRETQRAYMGLAINYGDASEVIPLVQDTSNLEYNITVRVRKLVRESPPKIAFVTTLPESELQEEYGRLYGMLGQEYEVSVVNPEGEADMADDIDVAIVINGASEFSDKAAAAIDRYVQKGRSAAFLLDAVKPDFQTMAAEERASGLSGLLGAYGVKIGAGLVLDKVCATISVSQRIGPLTIPQPVSYPFMPLPASLDPDHPLTRGLAQVAFPFVSPLELAVPESSEVVGQVLVRSSAESYVHSPPYDLNPMRQWRKDELEEKNGIPLVISLSGPLSTKKAPAADNIMVPSNEETTSSNSRVLVIGGSSVASNQFMSKTNETFVLNLMDWLLLDEDLLAVRSRGLAAAPLGGVNEEGQPEELSDGVRLTVRYANVVGVPLAFIAFGIIRWRMRESRRKSVTL